MIMFLPLLALIPETILWVWAGITVFSHPFSGVTIFYIITAVLWLVFTIPSVICTIHRYQHPGDRF